MTQQERFEAWATSQGINITDNGFGGYDSQWTEGALAGWEAAQAQAAAPAYNRDAVVVNLMRLANIDKHLARDIADAAFGPVSQAAVDPVNEWTVIAPDGTRFTGPTPLKAAFPASKYRLEIDPVAAAKFAEVIEQIREEGERENDECMEKFGTLDCPHCGGSGHIGDVQAADDKIKALAAGVKPFAYEIHAAMCEPELSYTKGGIKSLMQPLYTATAIAAARVQAINECEAAIKSSTKGWGNSAHEVGLFAALDAIRALIGKEST